MSLEIQSVHVSLQLPVIAGTHRVISLSHPAQKYRNKLITWIISAWSAFRMAKLNFSSWMNLRLTFQFPTHNRRLSLESPNLLPPKKYYLFLIQQKYCLLPLFLCCLSLTIQLCCCCVVASTEEKREKNIRWHRQFFMLNAMARKRTFIHNLQWVFFFHPLATLFRSEDYYKGQNGPLDARFFGNFVINSYLTGHFHSPLNRISLIVLNISQAKRISRLESFFF
jgi:hypothetical protein